MDGNETTLTPETKFAPYLQREVHRYNLNRDRPLNRSPQRLSFTPDSEVSTDCETHPSPHVRIGPHPKIINSPPGDETRIDSRRTDISSENDFSSPNIPIEDHRTAPPIASRNPTSRKDCALIPHRKHQITLARHSLRKTNDSRQPSALSENHQFTFL